MPAERDELHFVDEAQEAQWIQYFTDFRRNIYPVFAAEGIEFGLAVTIWRLNAVNNNILELVDKFEDQSLG